MFDSLSGHIWFDGTVIPWEKAHIHVMTHALHYASSVYEGLRSYGGKILYAHEHYERLHQSADYLNFKVPYSIVELVDATQYLVNDGKYNQGYVRAIAWCGSKKMTVSNLDADVHTAIGVWERPITYPENYYTEGIKLNIASWRRPDPRTAPVHSKASGLYMTSSMSIAEAVRLGYNDALMLGYKGNIAEATSSNIFLVIDGKLYTPVPDCFLNGITRRTVIKIAENIGIKVKETVLTLNHLSQAQEVFLTGTAIEILPVGSIDNGKENTWQFKPGKITDLIRAEFKNITSSL